MSKKKKLIARELFSGDVDAWEELARDHGTIFDSVRWTEMFRPALRRIGIYDRGDNLRGGFSLYEQRRFGMRLIRNPPFTPQIGPFFERRAKNSAAKTNEQRTIMEAMAEYLTGLSAPVVSIGLSNGIEDCLPFIWRDYKVVPHYTYRIDLKKRTELVDRGMSTKQRHHIRKAKKDGVIINETPDTTDLRSLVSKTYIRQNKSFPQAFMNAVLNSHYPGDKAFCFVATISDNPIAAVYFTHDSHTAWNLMTGYDNARSHHGAGALAMYHAILKAKSLGLTVFDFEGSMIPPIEKYFRGFGGRLTPIFSVHKALLPLEMALKFFKRRIF